MLKRLLFSLLLLVAINKTSFTQNCTVNAGVDIQYCPGEQMKLFGNVTGLYNGATITWSQISGPAVTITNTNSLTTNCGTATAGATYVFQISSLCQDGNTATDQVTYTVYGTTPLPPPANAGPTINIGCLQWGYPINLNATPATAGFIGTWSIVSGGQGTFSNVNSPTSTFTPYQQSPGEPKWTCPTNSNSYVLKWTLVSTASIPGNCPTSQLSTSADVTVNAAMWNPVDARAVPPGCANSFPHVFLYGTCPGTGSPSWSLVSGPVGYTYAGASTQDVTLFSPPSGTYTFRYTVTAGSPACVVGSKDVTFTVTQGANFAVTTSNANAGNIPQGVCAGEVIPSPLQLSANNVNVGETGTWSQISGGNTVIFSNVNDPNAIVTGMTNAGAPYKFRWTITGSTGCSSFSDIEFRVVSDFVPNSLIIQGNCTGLVNTGGGTSFCNSSIKTQIATTIPTNIPVFEGWYIDGYYLNTKPENSPLPLGFKPNVYLSSNISYPSYYWYSEASDNSCPNFGLNIAFYRNSSNTTLSVLVYMQRSLSGYTGTYSGTIKLKNVYCASAEKSFPFSIEVQHDVSGANAGTDQVLACNVTQTNLAGNDPLVTPPYYGVGRWEQISGPNTAVMADKYDRSTLISSLVPGTYAFKWLVYAGTGSCPSSQDTVLVRVSNAAPSAVYAGANQTVCYGTPVTLTAGLSIPGDLQTMLTNSGSTGSWSQVSGPAGAVITSPNNISTTITGLVASSVYVFRYTATNFCGSTTSDVTITTNATQGASQADAGSNQCLGAGTNTFNLSAALPASGTGLWTALPANPPGATITSAGSNATTVTGATTNGIYGFVFAISQSGCGSTTDTVYISNAGPLSAANAGPDQNVCAATGTNTFTLAAVSPSNGTGHWEMIQGKTGTTFNPTQYNTTVTPPAGTAGEGTYQFKWVVENGACTPLSDVVQINFFRKPDVAVATTANADLCWSTNGQISLTAQSITSGTGLWSFVDGGGSITSPASTTTTATVNPGSNTIRWSVNAANGVCPSTYDDVIVTYTPNANAKNDTAMCNATNALLKGGSAGMGTGNWTLLTQPLGSPAVTITQQGSQDSVVSAGPLATGVYTFRYTVTKAGCPTTTDDMQLTIDAPVSPNAGTDLSCLLTGSAIPLAGSTIPSGTTATWSRYTAPSGASSGTFSAPSSATTNYNTPNVAGTYNFQYQFATGSCRISDYVQATVVPLANGSAAANYCDNATGLNLTGSSPSPVTGSWSVVSQPAGSPTLTWTNQNTQNANVKGLTVGTYVFRYTIAGYLGCAPTSKDVTVNSTCFVLPVKLEYFTVSEANCNLSLKWKAEAQDNFERYELELSKDGANYVAINSISGVGSQNTYEYTMAAATGKNYYRLKMIDKDGRINYSDVKVISSNCNKKSVLLFPNPAIENMTIRLTGYTGKVVADIFNSNGQKIMARDLVGATSIISTQLLPVGSYFLVLRNSNTDGTERIKFQVVR